MISGCLIWTGWLWCRVTIIISRWERWCWCCYNIMISFHLLMSQRHTIWALIASHTRRGAHLSSSYMLYISTHRFYIVLKNELHTGGFVVVDIFITHMCSVSLVERRIKPVWSRIKRKSIGWKRLLRKQSYTNPYIYTFIWSQTCIWSLALTHALVNRARSCDVYAKSMSQHNSWGLWDLRYTRPSKVGERFALFFEWEIYGLLLKSSCIRI